MFLRKLPFLLFFKQIHCCHSKKYVYRQATETLDENNIQLKKEKVIYFNSLDMLIPLTIDNYNIPAAYADNDNNPFIITKVKEDIKQIKASFTKSCFDVYRLILNLQNDNKFADDNFEYTNDLLEKINVTIKLFDNVLNIYKPIKQAAKNTGQKQKFIDEADNSINLLTKSQTSLKNLSKIFLSNAAVFKKLIEPESEK